MWQQWLPTSLSVTRNSTQQSEHRFLEDRLLFSYPNSCNPRVHCFRNLCRAACHIAEGGDGSYYFPKSWQWLILMQFTCPSFPLEFASPQQTPEFQNSDIRHILTLQLLSSYGDRSLVLPTLPLSLKSLLKLCNIHEMSEPWQKSTGTMYKQFCWLFFNWSSKNIKSSSPYLYRESLLGTLRGTNSSSHRLSSKKCVAYSETQYILMQYIKVKL